MKHSTTANRNGAKPAGGSFVVERVLWPAWCAFTRLLPVDMTRSESTHRLSIAGQCTNLSCKHSPSDWHPGESSQPYNVPAHWILPSLVTLRRRGLCEVVASNYGDKVVRLGWQALCNSQSLAPHDFLIINDLTAPMHGDELVGLLHMDSIHVSLETAEPELFAQLHHGKNLQTVLQNMDRVRALAQSRKIRAPEFVFDIEITSRTANELEKIVQLGVDHGVRSFSFRGLYKGSRIRDEFEVFSVRTLPWSELSEALAYLERAMELARDLGCKVRCDPRLYNGIREELGKLAKIHEAERAPVYGNQTAAMPVPRGMTRNCSLPWTYINVCAHGQVRPCSEIREAVGNLHHESMADLVNGPKIRQVRRGLLTGSLNGDRCQRCTIMPVVSVDTFRRDMRGNLVLWALRSRMLNLLRLFRRS